ncbi:MAG: hypothetical protein ACD_59C00075G0003 [uncultured bacterium]|nr:MAG: hypothetical protein ACD_59C00075G0003 [uncultured bacterium]
MFVSKLKLKNWRNFLQADVNLNERVFIVGPNASGKSNFLDVFRFLSDISKPGGGLQKAISDRGGIKKIRCLSARNETTVRIEAHLKSKSLKDSDTWIYILEIVQQPRGNRLPEIRCEKVLHNDKVIVNRPDVHDKNDEARLTQTFLEQINANKDFRDIVKFFESITYFHLIPQLLRHPDSFVVDSLMRDIFGHNFLERLAKTSENKRETRLNKITEALKCAVPNFSNLKFIKDDCGKPHLEALYKHWRQNAGLQREDQFSDGTLRLIAFLWILTENNSMLLLEEPELSLHTAIVSKLPSIMYRVQNKNKNKYQTILSTHSFELLSNHGIGSDEILLLTPTHESTIIKNASQNEEIKALLASGMTPADAIIPFTTSKNINQLELSFK